MATEKDPKLTASIEELDSYRRENIKLRREIETLKVDLKINIKYVEQLKGHFVKICKIKNILEEK